MPLANIDRGAEINQGPDDVIEAGIAVYDLVAEKPLQGIEQINSFA